MIFLDGGTLQRANSINYDRRPSLRSDRGHFLPAFCIATRAQTKERMLPVFLGDVFEDGFDGSDGVGAVGLLEGNVAIAAQ